MSTDTPRCTFVDPQAGCTCFYPEDHGIHREPSTWAGSHPFAPPIERTLDDAVKDMHARWARQYDEYIAAGVAPSTLSREYLVDPIGQILCTFRLAGGPCGKDSFDTVHRAHTDHPGFCGVYTCHAFRPEEDRAKRIEDAVREAIKELRTNICTREVIASYLEGALG